MVQWFSGSMVQWFNGSMVPSFHDSMVICDCSAVQSAVCLCKCLAAAPVFLLGATHSRPQSPSFLGHGVGKRGGLEAAVTGCQKNF